MIDADPDQADIWKIEPATPAELAAGYLLLFSGVGGVGLVIYAIGSLLGAWQ